MTALLQEYGRVASRLPGRGQWLRELREKSLQRFDSLGLPTSKDEAWKYTRVSDLAARPFRAEPPQAKVPLDRRPGRLVLLNGTLSRELSDLTFLPPGVELKSVAEILETDPERVQLSLRTGDDTRAFTALNTAFLRDGLYLRVADGVRLEKPLEIFWVSEGNDFVSHGRVWITLGRETDLTVVERFEGQGTYWNNGVTEVEVGAQSRLRHVKVQQEGGGATHLWLTRARLDRGGRFESHYVSRGGRLVRNEIETRLEGEGAECVLNGLLLGSGRQHTDARTLIDHAKPHCRSRELYKGIFGDEACGVFDGKILVRPAAQKTDAAQTNKNLLLSPEAEVNAKPQLEIYADDVKCAHGATTGQLDPNALFYLRARGLARDEAKRLLTSAFAREVLEAVPGEALRETLARELLGSRDAF